MTVCEKCGEDTTVDLIITDQFRGIDTRSYCESCFFDGVQTAFNYPDLFCNCGEKLVLEINDREEVIDLARENEVIFYICEKIFKAKKENKNYSDELENNHDSIGFYTMQPEEPSET